MTINTYAKFAPTVFVAKCPEAHRKGEIITLTSKYGKETDVEIYNCVSQKDGFYFYSFVRCDGMDSQAFAQQKADRYQGYADNAMARIAMQYLKTAIGLQEREHFMVLFLDNQHRLIKAETLFKGTVNSASVYPREIVKRTLNLNATAVIVAHNHPSGEVIPSTADKQLTEKISQALALIDARLLDHIVVSVNGTFSFRDFGLLNA